MESDLNTSVLKICTLLAQYNVRYLLIGGVAVALNGYYRHSVGVDGKLTDKPDIDIWYYPTYENYFNILKVMQDLGQDTKEFWEEQTPNPRKSFFKLDFEDFTLDLLPEIKAAIGFTDADSRKETIMLDNIPIHYISYEDLLKDKEASARDKDLEDIQQLRGNKETKK